MFVKFKWNEN
jgi:hypothetical protein